MSSRQPWRTCLSGAALAALFAALTGCGSPTSRIELRSYKDPYFPETYHVTLADCAYRVDATGDRHIVGRATTFTDGPETAAITQYLHVHVFWQPKPGRTHANATTTNADLRYVIVTPTGTAVYAGTGFVYPKRERWGTLTAELESGNLRLVSQTGSPAEVLGDASVRGTLVARKSAPATVDLMRQIDVYAGGSQ